MTSKTLKQYAFVQAYDLDCFEVKLNEKLEDLADGDPEVAFVQNDETNMIARICYSKEIRIEEEGPAERGARFTCGECPYFRHIRKKDGSPDLRRSFGDCDFGEMGRVWKTTPACEYLYKMITDGKIRLALEEEEEA